MEAVKYYKHQDAEYKVMGMWIAYHDAYADMVEIKKAMLHVEKTGSMVLLIAGHEDEAWPVSSYRVDVQDFWEISKRQSKIL